jgi:hypothetical protein
VTDSLLDAAVVPRMSRADFLIPKVQRVGPLLDSLFGVLERYVWHSQVQLGISSLAFEIILETSNFLPDGREFSLHGRSRLRNNTQVIMHPVADYCVSIDFLP